MVKKQGMVIPHEHGGWAMVSVPFAIGMLTGKPQWMHVFLFLAWLFLYLASYPFLQSMKRRSDRGRLVKWGTIYGVIAVLSLIPPLLNRPQLFLFGPILLGLLAVNIWNVKRKTERALFNDLCAILIFSLGGAAAYLLGGGGWDATMILIVAFNLLYFMGSVFFCKVGISRAEKQTVDNICLLLSCGIADRALDAGKPLDGGRLHFFGASYLHLCGTSDTSDESRDHRNYRLRSIFSIGDSMDVDSMIHKNAVIRAGTKSLPRQMMRQAFFVCSHR
ncbi:YwiC-like family protein [Paenibacillus sp. DMB20]|uniref:YwiC-like family protein n=1 Tax=Paenibacillus sp. DMB20 TaxID=1642570 RepID=UPI000B2037F1